MRKEEPRLQWAQKRMSATSEGLPEPGGQAEGCCSCCRNLGHISHYSSGVHRWYKVEGKLPRGVSDQPTFRSPSHWNLFITVNKSQVLALPECSPQVCPGLGAWCQRSRDEFLSLLKVGLAGH